MKRDAPGGRTRWMSAAALIDHEVPTMQVRVTKISPNGGDPVVTVVDPAATTPTDLWRAAIAQRRELTSQLEQLQDQRSNLTSKLEEAKPGADQKGLESQIVAVDAQIGAVQSQLAVANAQVSRTAAVPGAVVEPPREVHQGPPEEVFVLGTLFMLAVLLPLSIAYARRIWRRGSTAAALPRELMDRLTRLDQAVDSIAVEVERIGEGQRFVTRLMGERPGQVPESLPRERSAGQ